MIYVYFTFDLKSLLYKYEEISSIDFILVYHLIN